MMSAKAETEVRLQIEDGAHKEDSVSTNGQPDSKARDPLNINESVKVTFDEIFAEPHSTVYSFDSVWLLSFKVFNETKLWCYRITSLIFGIPLAFLWGLHFGCLACCTIWCCRPGLKACQIELGCVQSFVQIVLDCLYKPLFVAVGYVFTNIRVKITKQAA